MVNDPGASMWRDFNSLRKAWARRPEAAGGLRALAGFDFQCASGLLAAAYAIAAGGPATLLEVLSDFAEVRSEFVVATQVKRTLTSSTLKSALKELWTIDRLAASEVPEFVNRLRYEVLSGRKELVDVKTAVANWKPDPSENDQGGCFRTEDLTYFKSRVLISTRSNPRLTLVAHLVDNYAEEDPFGAVDAMMGMLVERLAEGNVEKAAEEIELRFRLFEARTADRRRRFYLWQPADQPPGDVLPESDPQTAVLVGERPTLRDLREGRFADRKVYDDLTIAIRETLDAERGTVSGKLTAVWIGGRSGSGKSVALLHVLARLHAADPGIPIIWLDRSSERIAEAFRWARPFFAAGHQVVFAADDPYSAERQQGLAQVFDEAVDAFEAVRSIYRTGLSDSDCPPPLLVFCGPGEQADAFEDNLGDRVEVGRIELPPETDNDVRALRSWYEKRTGRAALPVGMHPDLLLVQIFFEWQTGSPIADFARSFRRRLQDMAPGVFELVAEILALNRLYALYPAWGLEKRKVQNPPLAAALDRLTEADGHFRAVPEEGGIRLTHPHLADAMYRSWFGRPTDRAFRAAHLRCGLSEAFAAQAVPRVRHAPLWALSQIAGGRHGSLVQERLDLIRVEVGDLLRETYLRLFVSSSTPLSDIPVWTDIDCQFALNLNPNPLRLLIDAALSAPVGNERPTGLRLACHKLLQHDPHGDGGVTVLLVLETHVGWSERPAVILDVMKTMGFDASAHLLADVVRDHWSSGACRSIVRRCLARPTDPAASTAVASWLRSADLGDAAWPGFFTSFTDQFQPSEEDLRLGLAFIRQYRAHPSWGHVWERLHDRVHTTSCALEADALSWLREMPFLTPAWTFVWEELWRVSFERADLRTLGLRWLRSAPLEHGSYHFVWTSLCEEKETPERSHLLDLGDRWLRVARRDHRAWGYFWRALYEERTDGRKELLELAREWLIDVPNSHAAWPSLWKLVQSEQTDTQLELVALAQDWLDREPVDNLLWQSIWEICRDLGSADPLRSYEAGNRWLREAPLDHSSWNYIWQMQRERKDTSDLKAIGLAWLQGVPPQHGGWQYVWEQLWLANEDAVSRTCLRKSALRWLNEAPPEHKSWGYVWQRLRERSEEDDSILKEISFDWLGRNKDNHATWVPIWLTLWQANATSSTIRKRLRRLAADRLAWIPSEEGRWPQLWKAVWADAGAERHELRDLALHWLARVSSNNRNWPKVWGILWYGREDDTGVLVEAALAWLTVAPAKADIRPPLQAVLNHGNTTQATAAARCAVERLRDRPKSDTWAGIWLSLWSAQTSSQSSRGPLARIGANWLQALQYPRQDWAKVWIRLWRREEVSQDVLRASAERLLHLTPVKQQNELRVKLAAAGFAPR